MKLTKCLSALISFYDRQEIKQYYALIEVLEDLTNKDRVNTEYVSNLSDTNYFASERLLQVFNIN
jgi:hypothetical protein